MSGGGTRGIPGYSPHYVTVLRRAALRDCYSPGMVYGVLGRVPGLSYSLFRVQSPVSWAQSGESPREGSVGMANVRCNRAFPVTQRPSQPVQFTPPFRIEMEE
jgi:hypothetical protein